MKVRIIEEKLKTINLMRPQQSITIINLNTMREMRMKKVRMDSHNTKITMKMMEMEGSQ